MTSLMSFFAAMTMAPNADPAPTPDLIAFNGKFWTGDTNKPEVEAIAVQNGRILRVGTSAELKATATPTTKLMDLGGRRVVPGIYDSHVHFLGGGRSLAQVDLKDAKDEAEFGKRLAEFDAKTPRGRWLLGGNWDHDRAFAGNLPTAANIDKYVKDRPVFIRRYDGHMALANTAALKLAKVTAETKDPAGGVIDRLADGKTPSGLLRDNAMDLVDKLIPEPEADEIAEGVKAALKHAAEVGVTSVEDMDGNAAVTRAKYLNVLKAMAEKGELSCRLQLRSPIPLFQDQLKERERLAGVSEWVTFTGVKGFMDGSLGSSTAKMFAPYVTGSMNTGVYVNDPARMKQFISTVDKAKISVAIHAIGDQANAVLLDLFDEVAKMHGPNDRRFRIEHAQHLRPEDYSRFKKLGVIASMQPYHVIDDGRWAEGRIGAKRCESSYAYRGLLDAGAILAFGSDWPVAPLNPWVGLDAAVNRRTLDNKHPDGWFPSQKISVAETMTAYTSGSAYAGFKDKDCGTLIAGKLADFVVLDRDIFDTKEKNNLAVTKVMKTIVGGKVVFESK